MRFTTLGPSGSNHHYVTRRFLEFHRIQNQSTLDLVSSFEEGTDRVLTGHSDFMIQCAVHPATMATVAKFFKGLYVVDSFIAPSHDLAIIQRRDVNLAKTLAVMRPTLDYVDPGAWEKIEMVDTVAEVTQGLIDGRYAAGVGYASVARTHPDMLRVVQFVGTVDDAWIVYARTRVTGGNLLAWRECPASALYRQQSAP